MTATNRGLHGSKLGANMTRAAGAKFIGTLIPVLAGTAVASGAFLGRSIPRPARRAHPSIPNPPPGHQAATRGVSMSPKNDPKAFEAWIGHELDDADGTKVGKIDDVYYDTQTEQPEWVTVTTGMFGSKKSFVPVHGAQGDGDRLRVNYPKDLIKDAPRIDPDGELSVNEEHELYRHYGLESDGDAGSSGQAPTEREGKQEAKSAGDGSMVRSEEELKVGTRSKEAGRVRLRKHVVTEMVTKTVPVQREVVSVEREPIEAGDADRGGEISEDAQEVVLHEDEVVTQKEVVAKERVSLGKDVKTEEQEVQAEVRKEQVEVDDGPTGTRKK